MDEKTKSLGKNAGLDRISRFSKTGVRMENNKSIEIGFAIFCGLVWGALAGMAFAMFSANVSGYPPWSITGVIMAVSLIGFVLTIYAFIIVDETG